jgi:hypothetical protein
MSGNIYYIDKYARIVFVHSNIENIGVNYHISPENQINLRPAMGMISPQKQTFPLTKT